MKFKLDFKIPPLSVSINIKDDIILLGSCFSQQIGRFLLDYKFKAASNPFGTVYNPHSIFNLIKGSLKSLPFHPVSHQGRVFAWECHSDVWAPTAPLLSNKIIHLQQQMREKVKRSRWIIVTPGTSWIYEHKDDQLIVANCHKIPAKAFTRRMLEVDEMVSAFQEVYNLIGQENPDLQWIFTISPVRHIRDGLIENNQSKARLHEVVYQITQMKGVHYFPSYEIMMDELRDYRYYASDLLHPSDQAARYIWDAFIECCVDHETNDFIYLWTQIKKDLDHRPFNPDGTAHKQFLKNLLIKIQKQADKVDVTQELLGIQKQLAS